MATLAYRLRIRNATDDADELVITSLAAGPNPYIAVPPSGEGQTLQPSTGEVQVGGYTVSVIDVETTPGTRVVTSKLADDEGRQQLMSRRAFIEETENDGGLWTVLVAGYVNGIRLVTALRYDFAIGESQRVEQTVKVFERIEPGFERVSCIMGGPIIGDFGPYTDHGRPTFAVDSVSGDQVHLEWVRGPLLPDPIHENTPPIASYNRAHINRVADHYLGDKEASGARPFLGLACRLFNPDTGDSVVSNPPAGLTVETQDFTPLNLPPAGNPGALLGLFDFNGQVCIRWPASAGATPSIGTLFKLAIFPRHIDQRNPLHWRGHPMDLVTGLLTLRGEAYNAASAATVRSELGEGLTIELRLTSEMTLAEALERLVYGPFGVAARTNSAGEREFFTTRRRPSSAPVSTISADELTTDEGVVWSLEEQSAVNLVSFKIQVFSPLPGGEPASADAENPIDWLGVSSVTVEAVPPEGSPAIADAKTVSYELPGGIVGMATGTPEAPGDLDRFVAAIGSDLFDFQARGAITSDLSVRRGVTTAQVGQEIILNLPHLPTASPDQTPTSQRGTVPRVAVILRRTPTPAGPVLKVQDRGIAPPIELVPTFTIAQSGVDPRRRATVTVTNGGSLALAGCIIRVELATGLPLPTSGHTVRVLDPAVDATVFDLPPMKAGDRVWARLRAEKLGQPAGPFTAFQSADLQQLSAPSNLQGASVDGIAELSWTVGEPGLAVEVTFALSSTPTVLLGSLLLPPGSTECRIQLPSGVAEYLFSVRHREFLPFESSSTAATLLVDGQPAVFLEPPADPVVYSFGDGIFGIEVIAAPRPTWVEFWVATETAKRSGVPGPFTLAATQQPQRGGFTSFDLPRAPQDGKRRFLKARHAREGSNPSLFTTALSVDPWRATAPLASSLFRDKSVLIDDYTGDTTRRWKQLNKDEPGAGTFRVAHDPDAQVGASVGRATGWVHLEHGDRVPYDPKMLHAIWFRVRQLRNPTLGGKKLFLGVNGLAQEPGRPTEFAYVNREGANSPQKQHYVAADGVELDASREFTDFYAFFQGFAGGNVNLTPDMVSAVGFPDFSAANLVSGDTSPTNIGLTTDDAQEGAYVLISSPGKPLDLAAARLHFAEGGSTDEWEWDFADDPAGPWTPVPS